MPLPLLIGDRWVETQEALHVTDPYTGAVIADVATADEDILEEAICTAHRAFEIARMQPPFERATLLEAVADAIETRRGEFTETIISEAGKPRRYADTEVSRAVITFRTAAQEARKTQGELLSLDAFQTGKGHFGLMKRFPLGVVTAITPFNFPLNLVAHKVAPCLATGNTMVLKPASKTPLTALLLGRVLLESGMPAGQVNVVPCSNERAAKLIRDLRIKKISFTGSPTVGWQLKEQSGKKRITLELGGNAGVILRHDANLAVAIPAVALGAFGAAGQSCISVQRVFLHESIYEVAKSQLTAYIRDHVKTGNPRDSDTVVGPMISAEALDKVRAKIAAALRRGAVLVCGGDPQGNCLLPTVLENVDPQAEVCTEEVFAPVCTLHRYSDFEEALRLVNDGRYGLQAGVYTQDLAAAFRSFEVLDVGAVLINQVPTWRVENMPYGGVKDSGFGREGVRYAMEEMTEPKALIMNIG